MNLQNLISGLGILNQANHDSRNYAQIEDQYLVVDATVECLLPEEVEYLAAIGWFQESWLDNHEDEDFTLLYNRSEAWMFK